MDDEPWVRHWFGDDDDLDDAIEVAKPFVYPTRAELYEALHNANASAQRLADTIYWDRAHSAVNQLLDDIVGR
jgi:hypothetical protein